MPKDNETKTRSLSLYDEFLANTSIDRLQKILARYELMKMVSEIPGDIVECGVFKGSGIYTLAKIARLLTPHTGRRIIGFDFFGTDRATTFKRKEDKKVLDFHDKKFADKERILANLKELGIENVELVGGDVTKTTSEYAKKNLGFRIALLYLDVDNYEGTLAILKHFYPLVSPGGIVVFDEYGVRGHGESDAVHDYFKGTSEKLRSLTIANTPPAYLIKGSF
ncbi:MAG: TylF/MycF/NovP-related O-methyltransferase [bacterium]|nr:TylF/MycF/NovP-related O-methyltransferase [bacterium]